MTRFTVAIPAYNEAQRIGHLLSFLVETAGDAEIIVYDDGSTDATPDIVDRFPSVRLIRGGENRGYAHAFNMCLRHASHDVIVILDADTLPLPGSIPALLKPFADPEVGAATGSHVLVNPRRGIANHLNHIIYRVKAQIDRHQDAVGNLWHLNGLIMAVRRSVIGQVPTRETNQDAFIGWLVLSRGYKTRYVPEAKNRFKAPSTVRDIIRSRSRVCRGHVVLGRKYFINPHTFTEVPFPLYALFVLKASLKLGFRGILAMLFGVIVDVWFRLYWLIRWKYRRGSFEEYKWRQITSTKRW